MIKTIAVTKLSMRVISQRCFTTASVVRHSHSHDHFNSDFHDHGHGHSHATEIPAPNPKSDPKARFDIDEKGRKVLKAHPFQSVHAHDDADFPELKEMDLDGEDFEINVNSQKPSVWNRLKKYIDPRSPIAEFNHQHSHSSDAGHTHSHGAHTAEELEFYKTGSFKKNPGVKITLIGLSVNIGMAGTKAVAGAYFHSQALVADAVHSVGDTISDVLTLSTVNSASKIPSDVYPLGFGKVETLGTLFVSSILLYAGIQIGWSSAIDILTPLLPHSVIDVMSSVPVHSHSHTHVHSTEIVSTITEHGSHAHEHGAVAEPVVREVANINAAWVAAGSIVLKEWLFRATKDIGEKMGSKVLIANAWHHRVDSLTSLVALSTISAGYFLNIYWLDSIGGLIVSLMIIRVGLSGVIQAFKELIDKAIPKQDPRYEDFENKTNVVLMQNDSNLVIKDLVMLPSGANLNCNLKLGIPSYNKQYENQLTAAKMGVVSQNLKTALHEEYPNLKTVTIEYDASK